MMTDNRQNVRIAFWQSNPVVGDIDGNIARLVEMSERIGGEADLLVTSECYGTGYPIQDLALRRGFVARFRRAIERLSERVMVGDIPALLIGGPEEAADLPHNAMWLLDRDGSIRVTRKHHLANAEVYDEVRTFSPGPLPRPMLFRGVRLGVMICEDAWHGDVARALAEEGADIIVCPNGSHFTPHKQEMRYQIARRTTATTGLPFAYLNLVGGQDEIVFDGGSFVMDSTGRLLHQAGMQENLSMACLPVSGKADIAMASILGERAHDSFTHGYPRERLERIWSAAVLGLRDYVVKSGFPGVLIGMSGGIDSALTAAMAVDALGADRVRLVRMPARWTGSQSMDDAAEASRMLGTEMLTVPVGDIVASLENALSPHISLMGVTSENLQPRARGVVLMGLSNATGWMVLSTGNKSEMTVGYATLYGDMCGGFNALKDIWKTDVFALSRWRNQHSPTGCLGPIQVMPQSIMDRPPTAELAPDQTDENSLGPYDELDAVLRLAVEERMSAEEAAREASHTLGKPILLDYARRIVGLAARAEYKRRQAPPGLVLSTGDFSKGWRLPLVNRAGL